MDFCREFEKAPKNLMKAKPNELLFAEDYPEGRMQVVCAAMNGERKKLDEMLAGILAEPEGEKHLVRALNNLKSIGHNGALIFAQAIFEVLEKTWDQPTMLLKFLQILDCVSYELRTGLGWIGVKAAEILDGGRLSGEHRMKLWIHWCAAVLRSSFEAGPLIEMLGPRRPNGLSRPQVNALRDALADEHTPWDVRGASLYLLLGNQLLSIDKAQAFVESAYASFPLESLEGVEILALAVEQDASALAEFAVIQAKLAQIRQENLFLRDMPAERFDEASRRVFAEQGALAHAPLEIALSLQAAEKNDRMVMSAYIDDVRKGDWIYLAKKYNLIRPLCAVFFENFEAENPVIRNFSLDIVNALVELANADALLAERWGDAVQNLDIDALRADARQWADFCR